MEDDLKMAREIQLAISFLTVPHSFPQKAEAAESRFQFTPSLPASGTVGGDFFTISCHF